MIYPFTQPSNMNFYRIGQKIQPGWKESRTVLLRDSRYAGRSAVSLQNLATFILGGNLELTVRAVPIRCGRDMLFSGQFIKPKEIR